MIKIPAGNDLSPYYRRETEPGKIFMNGQETFKFAVNTMVNDITELAARAGIALDDITHVVPHQANARIIQYAVKRLGIPADKFFMNIQNYGNTSAASIAIALDELNRKVGINEGDIIAMTAFGGGLSSASCIIRW